MSKGIGKQHAIKMRDYYVENRLSYNKKENAEISGANLPRYYIKLYRKQDYMRYELMKHREQKFKSKMSRLEFIKLIERNTKAFMNSRIDHLIDKIREEDRIIKLREYKNLGIKTTYKNLIDWTKESWFQMWTLKDEHKMIYAKMLLAESKGEVTINKKNGKHWWPAMIRSKIEYEDNFKATKEIHEFELEKARELHRMRVKNMKKRNGID
jgi:hypothetical protein